MHLKRSPLHSPSAQLVPILQFPNFQQFNLSPRHLRSLNIFLLSLLKTPYKPQRKKWFSTHEVFLFPSELDSFPSGVTPLLTQLPSRSQRRPVCGRGQAASLRKAPQPPSLVMIHIAVSFKFRLLPLSASSPPLCTKTHFLHVPFSLFPESRLQALETCVFDRQSSKRIVTMSHRLVFLQKEKVDLTKTPNNPRIAVNNSSMALEKAT